MAVWNQILDFWSCVDRSGGPGACHPWMRSRDSCGYGIAPRTTEDRSRKAHRTAWLLVNGPIPDGMQVLHSCDNPPCCNVSHLFLGVHADNMADMAAKCRAYRSFGNHATAGRIMPERERLARSVAEKGRLKSPDHREKIRVAALRRWELVRQKAEGAA